MKFKRTLAALLALLMTGSALASCSDNGNSAAETTQAQAQETTAPVETTTAKLTPDIPALDFKGAEFLILTSGETDTNGVDWVTYDVYAEEENGDPINDAVYARNMFIAETYNAIIKEKKSETSTLADSQKVILAGEHVYDAVISNLGSCSTLAQSGQTLNLYDIPHIDLEQPWWDGNLVKNLSIANKVYFATGDITVIDNDAIWVLMFNKDMYNDYGFDSIYELVENDKWVIDKFIETAHAAKSDLNGDGKMALDDDRFGLTTSAWTVMSVLYGSGISITTKNKDDIPEFAFDLDRATAVGDKLGALMASDTTFLSGGDITPAMIRTLFEEGRALFYGEVLQCMQRMRSSDTDFGLVPWPKFTETQENFGTVCIATAAKAVTVPITQPDTEMTGAVLEAMAAESMYVLTPVYYEVALKEKYMRDSESVRMLDLILENVRVDVGFTYNWNSIVGSIYNSIKVNDGQLVSVVESIKPSFEASMKAAIDKYLEN